MKRVNEILNHSVFIEAMEKLSLCEKQRVYCKHTLQHFMDVARLAYISVLEEGLPISKEVIYAAALLHDIGKYKQYEEGIPHNETSAQMAPAILRDCGYTTEEINLIVEAIIKHRKLELKRSDCKTLQERFNAIFYEADKMSRMCFACEVEQSCNWSENKKNKSITL